MPDATEIRTAMLTAIRDRYKARLAAMSLLDRQAFVDNARREERWPSDRWVEDHARKMLHRRTPEQYVAWGQVIKRRRRTKVYAFVHVSWSGGAGDAQESLAFVDPKEGSIVWYNVETGRNVSIIDLDEPVEQFIARKGDMYWRLEDAELSQPETKR